MAHQQLRRISPTLLASLQARDLPCVTRLRGAAPTRRRQPRRTTFAKRQRRCSAGDLDALERAAHRAMDAGKQAQPPWTPRKGRVRVRARTRELTAREAVCWPWRALVGRRRGAAVRRHQPRTSARRWRLRRCRRRVTKREHRWVGSMKHRWVGSGHLRFDADCLRARRPPGLSDDLHVRPDHPAPLPSECLPVGTAARCLHDNARSR